MTLVHDYKAQLKNFYGGIKFYEEIGDTRWDSLIESRKCNFRYCSSNIIKYFKEYLNSDKNLSYIIIYENQTMINMMFSKGNKIYLYTPHIETSSMPIESKLISFFKNKIKLIQKEKEIVHHYIPKLNSNIDSIFFLYNSYFNLRSSFHMFVNLDEKINKIWGSLRSSYKSCINKKNDNLTIRISKNPDDVDLLKSFHFNISKRKTRTDKTWEIQKDLVKNSFGILFILEFNGEILGISFFTFDELYSYYEIGVYERSKHKNLNISHKLIWEAIKFFKSKKIKKIYLGAYFNSNDSKEININKFKSGFANQYVSTNYVLQ